MARKASRKTPKVWAGYLTYFEETAIGRRWITCRIGSPGWSTWLDDLTHKVFSYGTNLGSCTVRRETKQHGSSYWIAYKRIEGKLYKRYVGRSADLTVARLDSVLGSLLSHEEGRSGA